MSPRPGKLAAIFMNATKTEIGPQVQVRENAGYLFESTLGDGICFVPAFCLSFEPDGQSTFHGDTYIVRGWARRNGLFNFHIGGHRLFPNMRAALHDLETPEVVAFLSRIRHPEFN